MTPSGRKPRPYIPDNPTRSRRDSPPVLLASVSRSNTLSDPNTNSKPSLNPLQSLVSGCRVVGWGISEVETFRAEPTVRIQRERGQTVISTDPYAIVRHLHPLYMLSLFLFPGFLLALGRTGRWPLGPSRASSSWRERRWRIVHSRRNSKGTKNTPAQGERITNSIPATPRIPLRSLPLARNPAALHPGLHDGSSYGLRCNSFIRVGWERMRRW